MLQRILNYIEGQLIEPKQNKWIANYEPATGEVYSELPSSEGDDVEMAYQAANKAFPTWSEMGVHKRSAILLKIADGIEQRFEEFALAESRDTGKPLSLTQLMDIPRAIENFRFFATAIVHFHSESFDMGEVGFNYTLRRATGVAGLISPWNLPLYLFTWKIAPALAAGNTAVAKPSEITPMTAYLLSEVCIAAGLPKGVLNIVHGLGSTVGASIVSHPKITTISFTGGTTTGAMIAQVAAPMFKKISLELGGKNPTVVFSDCSYEAALSTAVRSSFTNQGQICLCGSRIFVQREIFDKFKEDFIMKVGKLKVGDPMETEMNVGAIVSQAQFEKVLSYIHLAKEEGGEILVGGKSIVPNGSERCKNGWFIEPTVIGGLSNECRVNQEEIFGPVVTLMAFDTEEEVISLSNSTRYGLAANVWTNDLQRAHRVASKLSFGIVWLNSWLVRDLRTPFGGMKDSGVGREGGFEALRFFTEAKNVFVKL